MSASSSPTKVSFNDVKVGDVIYAKTNLSPDFVRALGGGKKSKSRCRKSLSHSGEMVDFRWRTVDSAGQVAGSMR